MFQNLDVFKTAMAMARHAGTKQAMTAQNIANADTPGYRARDIVDFAQTIRKSPSEQRATRASHIHGQTGLNLPGSERLTQYDPNGNTVSVELEMVEAVAARRQHDRALAIYRSNLSILRTSLGRS